jgi:hypothetical protein
MYSEADGFICISFIIGANISRNTWSVKRVSGVLANLVLRLIPSVTWKVSIV